MALTCRQCGVIGSVVDTICRSCGVVLTNGSMPAISNPGPIASYDNNPNLGQPQNWNSPNNNQYNQYNPYPNNPNNGNWQNQYQNNQNNLPSWQHQPQQPNSNWVNPSNPNSYQQDPYSQPQTYPQYPQQFQSPIQSPTPQPQMPPMQMQRWPNPAQAHWGQPQQQVFIVNSVHPMGIYQERKSPALSVLLSFLLTGAGQLYNGQAAKGLLMLGACVVLWGFLLGWVVTLWSIYDAYITAKKINSGQRV